VGFSTAVLRPAIVRAAAHPWARSLVTGTRTGRAIAGRFVAGSTLSEALAVGDELAAAGIRSMLNHLGEHADSPRLALAAREAYLTELDALVEHGVANPVISVKPTQLGLDTSADACWANLQPILEAAGPAGATVMIDMEEHDTVDATLTVLERALTHGTPTGVAIQSYLRRSAEDVERLPASCRIRLVKGAYLEPRDVVFTKRADVDRNYRRLFVSLFARGHAIDVATHDPALIEGVRRRVDATPDGWSRAEFQMLYGVRRDLQVSLATQGYPVRVYIPYGTEWYPYLTRRLAERPANLWFFLSNLVRTR
jgi:proline dehydrogenase